jgi:hypothetical protein
MGFHGQDVDASHAGWPISNRLKFHSSKQDFHTIKWQLSVPTSLLLDFPSFALAASQPRRKNNNPDSRQLLYRYD